MHASPPHGADEAPVLLLRPVEATDRPTLEQILDRPDLRRRAFAEGIAELHPVDWAPGHRTFVATCDGEVIGMVELRRDDDDPDVWELSLGVDRPGGIGGRCVAAALFYAFGHLGAGEIWFWAPRDNLAIARIALRFGFKRSHAVKQPLGPPADVYELARGAWFEHRAEAEEHYLDLPVAILDRHGRWRGDRGGFRQTES